MAKTEDLERFARQANVRFTTFRRDGTPVPTPIWVVRDGDHLLALTDRTTGKVKRLRHTPRALLAPSNSRGKVADGVPDTPSTVEIVDNPEELTRLTAMVKAKYGMQFTIARLFQRMRGLSFANGVELRITLGG